MKVGDAGEAFFVFETDEDVPQDLITSPILQATQPGQKNQDIEAGRFGTKEGSDEEEDEEKRNEKVSFEEEKSQQRGARGARLCSPHPSLFLIRFLL